MELAWMPESVLAPLAVVVSVEWRPLLLPEAPFGVRKASPCDREHLCFLFPSSTLLLLTSRGSTLRDCSDKVPLGSCPASTSSGLSEVLLQVVQRIPTLGHKHCPCPSRGGISRHNLLRRALDAGMPRIQWNKTTSKKFLPKPPFRRTPCRWRQMFCLINGTSKRHVPAKLQARKREVLPLSNASPMPGWNLHKDPEERRRSLARKIQSSSTATISRPSLCTASQCEDHTSFGARLNFRLR